LHTAADTATFGLGDTIGGKIASLFGGPNADQLRQQTQAARDDIGPVASTVADVGGYAIGPGKLGVGSRLAEMMGGRWVPRVVGSALEGAGAATAGTAGHGDTDTGDLARAAALGLGTGAVTGGLFGARPVPAGRTTADMELANQRAWATGPEVTAVSPKGISEALAKVNLSLTPGERVQMRRAGISDTLNDINTELTPAPSRLTADDISKWQQELYGAARGSGNRLVNKFTDALDTSLGPAQPVVEQAMRATNRMKTSQNIDEWLQNPQTAPAAISKAIGEHPEWYQSHPELLGRLQGIADMGQPSMVKDLAFDAGKRAVKGFVVGGLAGPYAGVAVASVGNQARSTVDSVPIRRALLAAQHLNNTGTVVPPSAFAPQHPRLKALSDLARQMGYAGGAAGSY
jgi:hypothetical protein